VAKIKMDFEFDKEMDTLLRQTAQGETVFNTANPKSQIPNPKSVHLDADEISAFAENALPEKIRQKYTLHLADCERCRKSLSGLITLNSETENAGTISAEEKPFIAVPIAWYRKLFAFPNLAYTMGALVLVFSGIAAYTVLQSVGNSSNTEVSQISERQPNGKGMSSDGDQQAVESYSSNSAMSANMMMSNTASMNSSSNSAANFSAMPSAPILTANSNAATLREEADNDLKGVPKTLAPPKQPINSAKAEDSTAAAAPPPPPLKENEFQTDSVAQKQQNQAQNSIVQNQTNITPDSRKVSPAPMRTTRADNKSRKLESLSDDAAEKSTAETRVGGKTFKRENNVWYDSAYRGQTTVNVTRGTNEYKKLDSGLRGIADNLGGTIVIVWKQKAYRIQ